MWIKFLKPRKGLSYFEGDRVDFPDSVAKQLIEEGYAVQSDAKPVESDLPMLLPGRATLIKEGLVTKKQVLEAKNSIADLPGINPKMAKKIVAILSKADK